jgi:hypothetical protein
MAGGMGRAALAALAAPVHDMAQSFACSELLSHRAPWPVWDAQGVWGRLASVPRSPCRALERSIHLIVATRNAPARLGRGPSSATYLRPNAQSALACKHGHAHANSHAHHHALTLSLARLRPSRARGSPVVQRPRWPLVSLVPPIVCDSAAGAGPTARIGSSAFDRWGAWVQAGGLAALLHGATRCPARHILSTAACAWRPSSECQVGRCCGVCPWTTPSTTAMTTVSSGRSARRLHAVFWSSLRVPRIAEAHPPRSRVLESAPVSQRGRRANARPISIVLSHPTLSGEPQRSRSESSS